MGIEITGLKQAIGNDVFRPNLYRVQLVGVQLGNTIDPSAFQFLCKGAAIPAGELGRVELPVRGRILKLPGDRKFDDWSVKVYTDDSWKVRKFFEEWHAKTNQYQQNISEAFPNVIGNAIVTPLNRQGGDITNYTIEAIWPSKVGEMQLTYDQADAHGEFEVTFAVNGVVYSAGQ